MYRYRYALLPTTEVTMETANNYRSRSILSLIDLQPRKRKKFEDGRKTGWLSSGRKTWVGLLNMKPFLSQFYQKKRGAFTTFSNITQFPRRSPRFSFHSHPQITIMLYGK